MPKSYQLWGQGGFRRKRLLKICLPLYMAAFLCLLFYRNRPPWQVAFLDVGQGDCAVLQEESGRTVVIDCGSSDEKGVGTYRLLPYLKYMGVQKVDAVFVSHADEDHISGIKELLETASEPGGLRIGTLLLSGRSMEEEKGQRLMEDARESGVTVQKIEKGAVLRDGLTELTCLHPDGTKAYADVNEASVVLALRYQEFSVMLTGDLEETGEREILEREQKHGGKEWPPYGFAVLKAGHHGSRTSGSEAWLEAVKPRLTLISCGRDNSYGHPHREALERLDAAGSKILQTTECGAITVESDGKDFRVHAYLQ